MRFTLRSGPQEIEIVPREELLELNGASDALDYLRPFLEDPHNREVLRRSLAEGGMRVGGHRFDDEDLLVVLAHRIASGELKVLLRRADQPIPPPAVTAEATPREAAQTSPPPASSPPREEAEESPAEEIEQAAQAATLVSAADSGAPLCET